MMVMALMMEICAFCHYEIPKLRVRIWVSMEGACITMGVALTKRAALGVLLKREVDLPTRL